MVQGDACNLIKADAAAEVQWVPSAEMDTRGLSSGVKKAFKLYLDAKQQGKGSIKKFFKPKAVPEAVGSDQTRE
jgi:hypothetical protein